MDNEFELLDPGLARAFLKSFSSAAQRMGEYLFNSGQVTDLEPEVPGLNYAARIQGNGQVRDVALRYNPQNGWLGHCTCPKEANCEHIFAAMRALVAEHNSAVVRNLSAGLSTTIAAAVSQSRPEKKIPAREGGDLPRRLMTELGRPLDAAEDKFVRKIRSTYARCCQSRQITNWDFQEMGLGLGEPGWNPLQIWPAFPSGEYEFWLYVAHAAEEHDVAIPRFMRSITDLGRLRKSLARWRRGREVERWKRTLALLEMPAIPPSPPPQATTELRLTIGETEARLEWRRPGQVNFEPLKPGQLGRLSRDYENGRIEFTPEAGLLWELFSRNFYTGIYHLEYGQQEPPRALGRILRSRLLESRVVTVSGDPLKRPSGPLRWEMIPASDNDDDYRLRLVQADGADAPTVLSVMPGNPALYLTADALFTGPPPEAALDSTRENRIPAPAIEHADGVAFLQSLGLELPPRLSERVQTLPFQIAICCELHPIYPDSKTEDCVVRVLAEAPDGHREVWTGANWIEQSPGGRKNAGKNTILLYDRAALAAIPPLLEPLNLKQAPYTGRLGMRVTRKFPETFAAWLETVPRHINLQLAGDLASFASPSIAGRVKLDATEAGIDWFDLRVVLDVADATLTAEEIKLLLNARGGYVRLAGKGWRRLEFNLSEEENDRLARLGLSTRELSAEPQRLHALQLADDAARKFLPAQQVDQIQRRAGDIKARVAPPVPAGVTAELRPYQLDGFYFLAYLAANRFGGILADDMGLGKTLQALAWLVLLLAQDSQTELKNRPSLVVCPKSVVDNWHAEAARFTPALRVKAWPAGELDGFRDRLSEADLHVLNYTQLRSLGESLVPIRWHAVILDEGQYIKNPNSQTAQVARALQAGHRLVLSGTPIENRLLDLWSLMSFAMPGILGSRAQFTRLYDAKGDPFARRRLSSRVRPFLLRRTKSQVAKDLPDRVEEDLFCEIEGEQKTLYRAELKRAQQLLLRVTTQKELAQQQFNFLTSLLRLRQICCHPRLVSPNSKEAGAKAEALLEQLEPLMEEGHKVLVFSQFVELLGLLRPLIADRNWPQYYLAGDTENRGELVQNFQSAEGSAVFLISLKAGGFGLNLTAASYVVLFDPWWNPAVEAQAIDRTHRIGQLNKVIAYRLLIKNSIEEKIRELQKRKKALAEDILGEERFAQSLSLADFQFLFAD